MPNIGNSVLENIPVNSLAIHIDAPADDVAVGVDAYRIKDLTAYHGCRSVTALPRQRRRKGFYKAADATHSSPAATCARHPFSFHRHKVNITALADEVRTNQCLSPSATGVGNEAKYWSLAAS